MYSEMLSDIVCVWWVNYLWRASLLIKDRRIIDGSSNAHFEADFSQLLDADMRLMQGCVHLKTLKWGKMVASPSLDKRQLLMRAKPASSWLL